MFRRVVAALSKIPLRVQIWWAIGLSLMLVLVFLWAARSIGAGSVPGYGCLLVFLWFLFLLWFLPTFLWFLIWLWNRLTYRVWVRLLISYLLIGIVPIPADSDAARRR